MLDYAPPLNEDTMFRGRFLPDFLRSYQDHFAWMIREYGRDRFNRVYDWLFNLLSTQMCFGQWIVVEKICPDKQLRPLLYFSLELIYQSDLFSQFHFERCVSAPSSPSSGSSASRVTELRVVMDPPSPAIRAILAPGSVRYPLVDWYSRLRLDPHCDPDIDPEWLGL